MTGKEGSTMLSEPLLALARRHNGWASEQAELFERLVPIGVTDTDFAEGTMSRSGITLRADLLGTFAADGTWLWAWGNDSFSGGAGTALCEELRRFGESEGIEEFTERLLDFGDYPDPRQMAYRLTLICMGVMKGRGAIVYAHSARGRTFMITRDPAVPWARPRAGRLAEILNGEGRVPGPVEEALRGYAGHHGLDAAYGDGRAEVLYPGGNRAVVTYTADRLTAVDVTGPGGGAPLPEPAGKPVLETPETAQLPQPDRLLPEPILGLAARCLAWSVRWKAGFQEHAEAELGGAAPEWDAGVLRFPGGNVEGRLVGVHDTRAGTWQWADADVPSRVKAEVKAALPELTGAPLDLAPYRSPGLTARLLAEIGAHCLKADGVLEIEDGSGRRSFVAVDGAWSPGPGDIGPETVAADIDEAARTLHPVTPAGSREETMYGLVLWAFRRFSLTVNEAMFPEERRLGGSLGLYEIRASFSATGDIIDVAVHTPGGRRLPHQ
jgi:hypothetical protein